MALSSILVNLLAAVLLMQNLQTNAATCKDCFVQSRAAHYPNSDEQGTDHGACGFGTFGATLNGGDVSAASELYRNGLGCGACYQTKDAAAWILAHGIVDIEYRRVSCRHPNQNITIKIDENSNNPYYLGFVIRYQQGEKDITAVQLCELLERSYGAVWTTTSPPSGPLSLRMLFSDDDGDESWVVPVNNIPSDWKAGEIYDTGVQTDV
ncbi:Expansin-like B1 [Linum perenne]